MQGTAKDVQVGDFIKPSFTIGDVGKGWEVVATMTNGRDVLIDYQGEDGRVHSFPAMDADDKVRITR